MGSWSSRGSAGNTRCPPGRMFGLQSGNIRRASVTLVGCSVELAAAQLRNERIPACGTVCSRCNRSENAQPTLAKVKCHTCIGGPIFLCAQCDLDVHGQWAHFHRREMWSAGHLPSPKASRMHTRASPLHHGRRRGPASRGVCSPTRVRPSRPRRPRFVRRGLSLEGGEVAQPKVPPPPPGTSRGLTSGRCNLRRLDHRGR